MNTTCRKIFGKSEIMIKLEVYKPEIGILIYKIKWIYKSFFLVYTNYTIIKEKFYYNKHFYNNNLILKVAINLRRTGSIF